MSAPRAAPAAAAAQPPPAAASAGPAPTPAPTVSPALSDADVRAQVAAAVGGSGLQANVPAHCYWSPWLCTPADWGWAPPPSPGATPPTPAPAPSSGWMPSWNSWTPAPSSAPAPALHDGLCRVLPWLCTEPSPAPAPVPVHPPSPPPDSLFKPSTAPLQTFYIYRVQDDETYPQPNHDMLNLAGGMWYLHNEVVWHENGRSGTYFSHPVSRIIKFKIQTRATQPLWDMGMNFGVFNAFDSGQCTGPFQCDNFEKAGFVVGCETWVAGDGSNFPHSQWNNLNHYAGAIWYSMPGECPTQPYKDKTDKCKKDAPGGLCPAGVTPTGAYDCTYQLEQMGELSIDELVGVDNYDSFIASGGREYDPKTDKGVNLDFWNGISDDAKCAWRVQRAEQLFRAKYPNQPNLETPTCDFNKFAFYPDRTT
mmetsp:Transcript_24126/g.68299  ORF Transcript_24126/g.68299 Transcript_24126/m.68299 type:complete len:422 (+) Transcript_24126:2-1267(+)